MKIIFLLLVSGILLYQTCNTNPGISLSANITAPVPKQDNPSKTIDFAKEIQPILISHCSPCHFTGGKMYERLPFDKAMSILKVEVQPVILKRIKDEKENELIRNFMRQNQGKQISNKQ